MRYVIAYDICDPKRLRRVARLMERVGLRTQKSVFLFHGDKETVRELLDAAAAIMKLDEDIVQAWKLAGDETADGTARGEPLNLTPPAVVLADSRRWLLTSNKEQES